MRVRLRNQPGQRLIRELVAEPGLQNDVTSATD